MPGFYEQPTFRNGTEITIYKTEILDLQGELAADMVLRWGGVAAVPDGYDNTGRQKMRLQTPEELANRACDTAQALVDEIRRREWVIDLPAPKPSDPRKPE